LGPRPLDAGSNNGKAHHRADLAADSPARRRMLVTMHTATRSSADAALVWGEDAHARERAQARAPGGEGREGRERRRGGTRKQTGARGGNDEAVGARLGAGT